MNHSVKRGTFALRCAILSALLVAAFMMSLLLGAQKLDFRKVFAAGNNFSKTIFFNIRLPRSLLAAIAGMLLAGAGASFQLFFRNPLAEPGIMGISAGASLGAVIASCFGTLLVTPFLSAVNLGAFAGALVSGIFVTIISGKRSGPAATAALLLCGTALGSMYSAITSIILSLRDEQLHTMYIWMLGSFSGRGWNELLFIIIPTAISIFLFARCSRELDLLSGGETTALALGVEVTHLRMLVIIAGATATSAAVCAGGTIGFVGLIAPHTMRRLLGSKARALIPLSMVGGAVLMLLADTLCRIIMPPSEIPVGTITALLGAPFFISLLFSRRGLKNG